ncbi:MAG: glycosyltransferase family 4 protein [Acidimicrobiales bacterium]|jgi:glycosyltransferase involved in cell wall biosynthesis|nr:glycosyltransferase family 4 protein [Acidimicrobiales bacterium]
MRIVMLGLRGIPASYGGVERHVEEIGARLVERGHEVVVMSRRDTSAARRRHRGMRIVELPTIRTKHLDATTHAAVATAVAALRGADVVHVHAIGPGLFSPLLRLRSGCTVVQTVHGFDAQRAKWGAGARATLGAATWLSARVPDAVIGVSAEITRAYASTGRVRAAHIPNGVFEPGAVPTEALTALGLEPRRFVAFVGRLVPEKRPDLLVEAYRKVPGSLPLVIAGRASYLDDYERRLHAAAARDPRVRLLGWVERPTLDALYAHAAAVVAPSRLEGLPLSVLEAAAHSAPLVLSDIGPHREIVGADGPGHRLVGLDDPGVRPADRLARALAETFAAPDQNRAGAARLREQVLRRFSWDAAATATEELYLALRAGGRGRATGTPAGPARRAPAAA